MSETADLVITNGTVVTETATFAASLAARDGVITAIGAASAPLAEAGVIGY
mgnify:CR=1 FL=1